jgi:hypothetical protein
VIEQVVCINDQWYKHVSGRGYVRIPRTDPQPRRGGVYTVLERRLAEAPGYGQVPVLILAEIAANWCWFEEYFRPVRPTSIALLREALEPGPVPIREAAERVLERLRP